MKRLLDKIRNKLGIDTRICDSCHNPLRKHQIPPFDIGLYCHGKCISVPKDITISASTMRQLVINTANYILRLDLEQNINDELATFKLTLSDDNPIAIKIWENWQKKNDFRVLKLSAKK